MPVYVALLRGINLAGKNRVSMKDLADIFECAGCSGVATFIQSGNVVFAAKTTLARRIPLVVADAISDRFGFGAPVVMRTSDEIQSVARANPFLRRGVDLKTLHVAFLADQPPRDRVASLDPDRSPPDAFVVRGREIYLQCPNGIARTKLSNAYFDTRLETTSTLRNWATVLKLAELVKARAS
jgi:uncharacterized protein (DUF1697 family)